MVAFGGAGAEELGVIQSPLEGVRSSLSLAGAAVAGARVLAGQLLLGDGRLRVRDPLLITFVQDVNSVLEEVVVRFVVRLDLADEEVVRRVKLLL